MQKQTQKKSHRFQGDGLHRCRLILEMAARPMVGLQRGTVVHPFFQRQHHTAQRGSMWWGTNEFGLLYQSERCEDETQTEQFHDFTSISVMTCEVAYGAWRRQGFDTENGPIALPGKYGVFGFNFNPLYNINHWLNAGVSLDGVYDRSANQYLDYMTKGNESEVYGVTSPPTYKQMALGMSGRAEFVMPYFTINMGIGRYFINAQWRLKRFGIRWWR